MTFCTNCGSRFDSAGNFCGSCGAARVAAGAPASPSGAQSFTPAPIPSPTAYGGPQSMGRPVHAAQEPLIATAAATASEVRPGRLFARFAAWLADLVFAGVSGVALGLLAMTIQPPDEGPLAWLTIVAAWLIYFAAQESSSAQATLGKRLVGLKVVRRDGTTMGFWRALGRIVVKVLSSMLLFGLGNALAAANSERRTLHDYTAGTLVLAR